MDIPRPVPGLVIRYAYLWRAEATRGIEEGGKDRPVVVAVVTVIARDRQRVVVVPITHSPPAPGATTIELTPETKRRLGLDEARSWIVLDEFNAFRWPGPDVRGVPGKAPETIAYGELPARLTQEILDAMRTLVAQGRLRATPRSE